MSRTANARAEADAATNASGGDGDGDGEGSSGARLRGQHGKHRVRKLWSGTIGVATARCLRSAGSVVAVGGKDLYEPGCPAGIDTHGAWPQLPPQSGAIVDGSLSYAYTRHLSFTGAFAYEPLPGTLIPEFLATYVEALRSDLELSHEISTFMVLQRGQLVAAVPEAVRLTETLTWSVQALQVEGGGFIEPTLGLLGPENVAQGVRPLTGPTSLNTKSVGGRLAGQSDFSLTAGLSAAAELRLNRHWALASAVTASNRYGTGYGPATLMDWNLLAVILHYRGWTDQLALEMAAEHPGGRYDAAVELSLTRNL